LQLETFEKGPQYKYRNGEWQEPFIKFLEEVLKRENYCEWTEEHYGPYIKAFFDNVGGYNKALIIMLEKYIEKLKKGDRMLEGLDATEYRF
jgi:hypothetical protein